jgi:signal transduction histidine kinase
MSLRTRLILAFTLVVFLCLFIATAVAAILLQSTRDQTALNRLEDIARPIYIQFRNLTLGQLSLTEVWTNLQEQAQSNNIYIIFVDSGGNIIRQITPKRSLPVLNVPTGSLPHGNTEQASGIFETESRIKFLYIAYPLVKAATETQIVSLRLDSIVLATPRSSAATIWASLIRPFFWAGLISLIVSILLAILLARSIFKPIQRLAKAAENVAQGKYDENIPATGPEELKQLAVSFNNMSAKVKESQQRLRYFVADASHQLKTPLTSIQGFAQAILDGTAGDKKTREKATRIIVDESKRMIRQVNELLELSRLQAGQVQMTIKPIDVKELLVHCQEIFAPQTQEKSLHLTNNIESDLTVNGDFDRLEGVFCNLLDNAIKNTPPQGEIQVVARVVERNIEITIADSGPGIPPEQLPYVFQRFQQGAGLRSGTGLGLAIAREIVLAHRGKIDVFSNPGEGARFIVTLPSSLE